MAEVLGLAASSLAVVGTADVVLKLGFHLCQFIRDTKDAPKDMRSLCGCIEDNMQLVMAAKECLYDLQNGNQPTMGSVTDSGEAFSVIASAIEVLKHEVGSLDAIVQKQNRKGPLLGRFRWALKKQAVRRSLEKLESAKSLLMNGLGLAGRSRGPLTPLVRPTNQQKGSSLP